MALSPPTKERVGCSVACGHACGKWKFVPAKYMHMDMDMDMYMHMVMFMCMYHGM